VLKSSSSCACLPSWCLRDGNPTIAPVSAAVAFRLFRFSHDPWQVHFVSRMAASRPSLALGCIITSVIVIGNCVSSCECCSLLERSTTTCEAGEDRSSVQLPRFRRWGWRCLLQESRRRTVSYQGSCVICGRQVMSSCLAKKQAISSQSSATRYAA
jgi:hypothetical protein